eukprot:SAG22_NODE_41_length_25488_cov_6.133719_6_plen_135_part_00
MDLAAELAEFKKEQEAKQAAEFAAFQEKVKKREEEKAAAAADPNPGFAQSYVDEKLREQGDRHGKAVAVLREAHSRETQEMKNKHEAAIHDKNSVRLPKSVFTKVATENCASRKCVSKKIRGTGDQRYITNPWH